MGSANWIPNKPCHCLSIKVKLRMATEELWPLCLCCFVYVASHSKK